MKIPKKITIKGKTWKVKILSKVIDDDGNLVYGLCDYTTRTISIEKGLRKKLESEVFLHEFFHACLHELEIPLSRKKDEDICEGLGALTNEAFSWTVKK